MSAIWDIYKYGKDNPFYNDPVQKAFYHPSPQRQMGDIAGQSFASTSHKYQHSTTEEENRDYFLDRSNSYLISRVGKLGLSPDGDSVSFNESWPQSEKPSTISISEVENLTPPSAASLKRSSVNAEKNRNVGSGLDFEEDKWMSQMSSTQGSRKTKGKESTLSKYVERFRNSLPMSREQRLQMKETDSEDFWWLQSPSSQSSQNLDPVNSQIHSRSVLQAKEEDSQLHDDEQLSQKSKLLQENMNNFLEKMSSIGSSHPAVSTVGLGSDTGSLVTLEEEPYRPAFSRRREPSLHIMPQFRQPQDDILYRWRIQRKRGLAKDQVTKFSTGPPKYNFSSQFQMTRHQMIDSQCSHSADKVKDTEMKRDAVIQTSGLLDEPPVSYIPVACPHVAPSDTISVVAHHCHLSCDLLTRAANVSSKDSRHNNEATSIGDGNGSKQVVANKAKAISGDSKMEDGEKIFIQAVDGDRDLSDENILQQETHCSCLHASQDTGLVKDKLICRKFALQEHVQKNHKPLRPQKVKKNLVVDERGFDFDKSWQISDIECQSERCCSEPADTDQLRDHRQRKHVIGTRASDRARRYMNSELVYTNSVALEDEDKQQEMLQKVKFDKKRGQQLCTPKNQSSPIPIRSTIRQVINDRLLGVSGSLASSLENFELSSLDFTVTELEEPVDDSSVPAADLGRSSPPVDLKSVIYSDGEEFAEDDILCNLRQRRLFCLQRLQELDQLILESKIA